MLRCLAVLPLLTLIASQAGAQATATDTRSPSAEDWSIHGQATWVGQQHRHFTSPYEGPNSLRPDEGIKETFDTTLFMGLRLWHGAAFYLNPEIDQGYGLSNTLGVAGFPSGASYKVERWSPYFRLPRAFLRQSLALGEAVETVESDANMLGGTQPAERLTWTVGKFAVTDVFDSNHYAHDPRVDFMNWAVVDSGAFDYAADAWGYTLGTSLEWVQHDWTLRGGWFATSKEPNSPHIDEHFGQRQVVIEGEHRHDWAGHPGAVRVLAFATRANMARYADAVAANPTQPDPAAVRHAQNKTGYAINAEQELRPDLGVFARYSANDGKTEAFDFTEINRSWVLGASLGGALWGQAGHGVGVAWGNNQLSGDARRYFAAGGLGILIGDGQLPRARREQIVEAYYKLPLCKGAELTADYQFIEHPAYNADRGPLSVWGLRLHAAF